MSTARLISFLPILKASSASLAARKRDAKIFGKEAQKLSFDICGGAKRRRLDLMMAFSTALATQVTVYHAALSPARGTDSREGSFKYGCFIKSCDTQLDLGRCG